MARNQFFADVRNAAASMAPRVPADNPFVDARQAGKRLRGGEPWLSGKTVQEFDPVDYPDLDPSIRADLARAVEEFRDVASRVNPQDPVRADQRDAASPAFRRIVQIVHDLARDDWIEAATALLAEAEGWAQEQDWPTKRYPKVIRENFIGEYSLDRLIYAAEGVQLGLIPVARYAIGTEGLFDLAVLPAFDSMPVARQGGRWVVGSLPGRDTIGPWARDSFFEKSLELARLP